MNPAERKLIPLVRELWSEYVERNFEGLFIVVVLVSVAAIGYVVDDKLAFLNFYFIPVLLAGYFLNVRSAVLGSVLSVLWMCLYAVWRPEAFYVDFSPVGLTLHLVVWGSFLILCGFLVARLNEQNLYKFARLRTVLEEWKKTQAALDQSHKSLEDGNQTLEGLRTKLESVLFSTMDAVTAHLAITERLANEKREVTVLRADFADFSASAASMEADEAVTALNDLFTQFEPIIASYHGHLDSFPGDGGVMAEFGIPLPAAQASLLAVLAGVKMQQKSASRGSPWKLRVGIAHGAALVGLVGSERRKSYTALGKVVELASAINRIAPAGAVCVDAAVHERIKGGFLTRRLFTGRTAEDPELLDLQLRKIRDHLRASAPTFDVCMEAGRLCSEIGESEQAIDYYEKALSLDPRAKARVERCVTEVRFQQESNLKVVVKGEAHPVEVFEVLTLKDPFDDPLRVPPRIRGLAETLFRAEGLNREMFFPLEALSGALGHSQVTAALSWALAAAMGLPEEWKRTAFLAGFYHSIGRRNLPPRLAERGDGERSLSGGDLEAIQSHPRFARAAIADLGISLPPPALDAVMQYRENIDGSGRPFGLKGDSIGLAARIVRLAHEYDTLTSWRPARAAWAPAAALAGMKLDADIGPKLDPKALDAFRRMLEDAGPK